MQLKNVICKMPAILSQPPCACKGDIWDVFPHLQLKNLIYVRSSPLLFCTQHWIIIHNFRTPKNYTCETTANLPVANESNANLFYQFHHEWPPSQEEMQLNLIHSFFSLGTKISRLSQCYQPIIKSCWTFIISMAEKILANVYFGLFGFNQLEPKW